jgi:hypothetical protein
MRIGVFDSTDTNQNVVRLEDTLKEMLDKTDGVLNDRFVAMITDCMFYVRNIKISTKRGKNE